MNFSEDILQKIEDYLNGEMNTEEKITFENQIKNNPELSETVKINKKLKTQYNENDWGFIKENKGNKKLNDLESILKSNEFKNNKKAIVSASELYFNNTKSKNSNSIKPKIYYAMAIAAVFLIFFGIFFKDNSLTNQEIYSSYNNWEELPSLISRGEVENTLLATGEDAFINKNYKLANEVFSSYIDNKNPVTLTFLLYLGISQLELKKYTKALKNFDKVTEYKSIDKSKGYWYKALTYLKMDDQDNAIKHLKFIVTDTSNYNYQKALEILENYKK